MENSSSGSVGEGVFNFNLLITSNNNYDNTAKKPSIKSSGVADKDENRKIREEKSVQIRKDKRQDVAKYRRMKNSTLSKSENPSISKRDEVIRNLESLAEKKNLIYSQNDKDIETSAEYFRRLLSIDRCPPIDVIIETGVLPRIIELLDRFDNKKIQTEVAWCITNIACGEKRHVILLVQYNVIEKLMHVIRNTVFPNVSEQCLWAISNLAVDGTICRTRLLENGILHILLWQLDIDAPVHMRQESPALTVMRYTAWTLCNLCRGQPAPPDNIHEPILYALSELLYSPDSDLLPDICEAICLLCELKVDNIQYCFELGMITRLRELIDMSCTRNNALRVVSMFCQSSSTVHIRVLMSPRYGSLLHCLTEELGLSVHALTVHRSPNSTSTVSSTVSSVTSSQIAATAAFKEQRSNKCMEDTCSEICKALTRLFITDLDYLHQACNRQPTLSEYKLIDALIALVDMNMYLPKLEAGRCICRIFLLQAGNIDINIIEKIYPVLKELLASTDCELLCLVLAVIKQVMLARGRVPFIDHGMKDSLTWLLNHPVSDVSTLAEEIDNIFNSLDMS